MTQAADPAFVPEVTADYTIAGGVTRETLRDAMRVFETARHLCVEQRPLVTHREVELARRETLLSGLSATIRRRLTRYLGQQITPQQHAALYAALQDCVDVLRNIMAETRVITADPVDNTIRFRVDRPLRGIRADSVFVDDFQDMSVDVPLVRESMSQRAVPSVGDLPGVLSDTDGNPIDYDQAIAPLVNWVDEEGYLSMADTVNRLRALWETTVTATDEPAGRQIHHIPSTLRLWEFWSDFAYTVEMPPPEHMQVFVENFEDLLSDTPVDVLRSMQYAAEVRMVLLETDELNSDASMSASVGAGGSVLELLSDFVERLSAYTDLPPTETVGVLTEDRQALPSVENLRIDGVPEAQSNNPLAADIRRAIETGANAAMDQALFDMLADPTNAAAAAAAATVNDYTRQQVRADEALSQLRDLVLREVQQESIMHQGMPAIPIGESIGHTSGLHLIPEDGAPVLIRDVAQPVLTGFVADGAYELETTEFTSDGNAPDQGSTGPDLHEAMGSESWHWGEEEVAAAPVQPFVVPSHIMAYRGRNQLEHQDTPSTTERASWALWSDRYHRFMVIEPDGSFGFGGSIAKLVFSSRTAAELFRPELREQLQLVAVQVRDPWFVINADLLVMSSDALGNRSVAPSTNCHARLLRVVGSQLIWMPDNEVTHQPIEPHLQFNSEAEATLIITNIQRQNATHILTTRSWGSMAVSAINMTVNARQDYSFRRPIDRLEVNGETGRPHREIMMD